MIILPDRNIPRAKILLPVKASEWRAPSRAQSKDVFGRADTTVFRIRANCHDGHTAWCGTFFDRDDADAFLFAIANGSLSYERQLWDLPVPAWRPDLGDGLVYQFFVLTFLLSPTGSNQSFTVPSDWANINNRVETIGAGGSGGAAYNPGAGAYCGASGGGGGAWNSQTSITLTPGGTATYQLGTGGAAINRTATGGTAGNNGGDTWFNGATLGASSVGSKGGTGGVVSTGAPGNFTGSAGGVGSSGVGSSNNNGGRGGSYSGTNVGGSIGTGGGAAGTTSGGGNTGGDTGSINSQTSGGSTSAGAAGGTAGNPGGNGTEMSSSPARGGGGGGGAHFSNGTPGTAGSGGNYGGGGGGAATNTAGGAGTEISGAGIQGLAFLVYQPRAIQGVNLAMMGL